MFALIENNKFVRWVTLPIDYPHVSFPVPVSASDLPPGVVIVKNTNPPVAGPLEVVELVADPEMVDGTWQTVYTTRNMTSEEAERTTTEKTQSVIADRNYMLSQSDWTQLPDAQVDKAAWGAYRQALRDVTSQPGFPWVVTWPVKPQ